MNLKDRLENIRTTNVLSIKGNEEVSSSFDVEQVFLDSNEVKSVLIQAIDESKNILFVSHPTMESSLVIKYFKQLFNSKEADVVLPKNLFDEVLVYENRINLIPSPSISEIIHILEKIMYGYKSFVFGITLGNSDYTLEKIKTAISLNNQNLSEENVDILLGTSDLILVNFDKNTDGLYYVSKIDKVIFENYKLGTLALFDSKPNVVTKKIEEHPVEEVVVQNDVVEEQIVEKQEEVVSSSQSIIDEVEIEKEEENLEENLEETVDVSLTVNEDIKEETTKKRNKYTALKEKVKRKKAVTQE